MPIGIGVEGDSPERSAKALIDPTHPEAGRGGVVPPVATRFKPGNNTNPGGMPKGTKHASARRAILRALAKGFEDDAEASSEDDRIGAQAIALASEIIEAARNGNADKVRAIATLIDQAEGKPTEHRINETVGEQVVILRLPVGDDPPDELPPGVE